MAMPEVAIGLFPDVGGTQFLNRMPDGVGMFLGLTLARFNGADAVAIGMADVMIAASKKDEVLTGLRQLDWSTDGEQNKNHLRGYLEGFSSSFSRQLCGGSKARCDSSSDFTTVHRSNRSSIAQLVGQRPINQERGAQLPRWLANLGQSDLPSPRKK